MIVNDQIEVHDSVLKRFALLEQNNRLAHAYLFIGPAGIGKGATALSIAGFLNCEAPPQDTLPYGCGCCPACLKIGAGSHPDVHVLQVPYGETIKIDQVRELMDRIRLRPFMARKKIFIVHNIENLTPEGGNAFLKTLEEPSANSLLLLTTSVVEKCLDTIRSRCHGVYFRADSQSALAQKLSRHYDVNSFDARFLAYVSEGCLGRAKGLKEAGVLENRDGIIEQFILGGNRETFLKKVAVDKKETKEFLDILLSWVRDCVLLKLGVGAQSLIHRGRVGELNNFQKRHSFQELELLRDEIVKTCRLLADNLNVKISLSIIGEML
jgi:DNA polymerase-3 subunit delta'